jgi:hypothetical protein
MISKHPGAKSKTHIVATLHAGFHYRNSRISNHRFQNAFLRTDPGWKSDIEKQIFLPGWKRPEGVSIWKQ